MESKKKDDINLFSKIKLGPYELDNRIAMAALTRCRADASTGIPNDLHVKYYSERAENTGFILTECTAVSLRGQCFHGACGIWNDEQVEGWKRVCEAVHKVNGRIYLQIWHCGRAGKSKLYGLRPVAPSAVPIRIQNKQKDGFVNLETPEALTEDGIKEILDEFRNGAKNALKAGFDGLQLHGANGYLVDQFLRDSTNKRKDKYGGTIVDRCRFPLAVMDVLISVFGAERVGVKLSPAGRFNDMFDTNPIASYRYFLQEISRRKVSFVEIVKTPESLPSPNFYGVKEEEQIPDVYRTFRPYFKGVLIANSGIDLYTANTLLKEKLADMVSFGRSFISNPDLVDRFKNKHTLTKPKVKLFYTGGEKGYIDYPKYNSKVDINMKPKF